MHANGQYRKRAAHILEQFKKGELQQIVITNYVVLETVQHLIRKTDTKTAAAAAHAFLTQTERIRVVYVDHAMDKRIAKWFTKFPRLSLTDCSLLVLAQELQIPLLHSFDKGFDCTGIKRLC